MAQLIDTLRIAPSPPNSPTIKRRILEDSVKHQLSEIKLLGVPNKTFNFKITSLAPHQCNMNVDLADTQANCFKANVIQENTVVTISNIHFASSILSLNGAIQELLGILFSVIQQNHEECVIEINNIKLWNIFYLGENYIQYAEKNLVNKISIWFQLMDLSLTKRLSLLDEYKNDYLPIVHSKLPRAMCEQLFLEKPEQFRGLGVTSKQELVVSYFRYLKDTKFKKFICDRYHSIKIAFEKIAAQTFYGVSNKIKLVKHCSGDGYVRLIPDCLTQETIKTHLIEQNYKWRIAELREIGPLERPSTDFPKLGRYGLLPPDHHIIWAGVEMPESYKMQLAKACELNSGYRHHLWWCPDMLPHRSIENIRIFARRFQIILRDILHTEFENKSLIHHHLQQHDFGRFSDILRYEEALSGIYTDTDIIYKTPFPSLPTLQRFIDENYGLLTSEETYNIGISNSMIVRSYGNPVIAKCRSEIAKSPKDHERKKLIPVHGHTANEVAVLYDTGPCFLSKIIANVLLGDDRPCTENLHNTSIDFGKLVFTRAFPNVLDVRCDFTWTINGRRTFEMRQHDIISAVGKIRKFATQKPAHRA